MFCKLENPLHGHLSELYGEDTARYILNEKFDLNINLNDKFKYDGLLNDIEVFMSDFNNVVQGFVDSSYFKKIKKVVGYDEYKNIRQAILNADNEESYNMIQRVQDIFSNPIIEDDLILPDGSHVKMKRENIVDYILNNKRDTYFISHYEMKNIYPEETFDIDELTNSQEHLNLVIYDYLFSKHPDDLLMSKFLADLSKVTGTEYIVLDDEEFYKKLLEEMSIGNGKNINPEEVYERLNSINAFVRGADIKKIYFRRSKLNKDVAIHETYHLVVDLIRAENPSLYKEIVDYIKNNYGPEYNKFIRQYEGLYNDSDESLEEEGVIYVLQSLSKMDIKKIKEDSVFSKIIYYIKKVIAYLLGGYHFNIWNEYFDNRLELMSDDIFLQEKLSQVNEILRENGLNLPYNNNSKPFIKFSSKERAVSVTEKLNDFITIANKIGFRNGELIDISIINNISQEDKSKLLDVMSRVARTDILYDKFYNKSYGLNYLSNIVITANRGSDENVVNKIKKLHKTLLSFDDENNDVNVSLMSGYLLSDVKDKLQIEDMKDEIKKEMVDVLLKDRTDSGFFMMYIDAVLTELIDRKINNQLKIKATDSNGNIVLKNTTVDQIIDIVYKDGHFDVDTLLKILDDDTIKSINDRIYKSFRKIFFGADYTKYINEAVDVSKLSEFKNKVKGNPSLTDEEKTKLLDVVYYFSNKSSGVITLDENVYNQVMIRSVLNQRYPEHLKLIKLLIQHDFIEHIVEYFFIRSLSDVYNNMFSEKPYNESNKTSYIGKFDDKFDEKLNEIQGVLKSLLDQGIIDTNHYSYFFGNIYNQFYDLKNLKDIDDKEELIETIKQYYVNAKFIEGIDDYIKRNVVPLIFNYYDVKPDTFKNTDAEYSKGEIAGLQYKFAVKNNGVSNPLLEIITILSYDFAKRNNNGLSNNEDHIIDRAEDYRDVLIELKRREKNEQALLKYDGLTEDNESLKNLTDEKKKEIVKQEKIKFILDKYRDYTENNRTYILPFGISLLLAKDHRQFNDQFLGVNGISTPELSLRFINFYNIIDGIVKLKLAENQTDSTSGDLVINQLIEIASKIKNSLEDTRKILMFGTLNRYLVSREKGVTASWDVKEVTYAFNYFLIDKFFYGAETDIPLNKGITSYDDAIYSIFVKTLRGIIENRKGNNKETFDDLVNEDIDKFVELLKELPYKSNFAFLSSEEHVYNYFREKIKENIHIDIGERSDNLNTNNTDVKYKYEDYVQFISKNMYKYMDEGSVDFDSFIGFVKRFIGGIRSNNREVDNNLSENILEASTEFNLKSNFFYSILLYENGPVKERHGNDTSTLKVLHYFKRWFVKNKKPEFVSNITDNLFKLVDITEYEGLIFALIHELISANVSTEVYDNAKNILVEMLAGKDGVKFTFTSKDVLDTTNLSLLRELLTNKRPSSEYTSVIDADDFDKSKSVVINRIKSILPTKNDSSVELKFTYAEKSGNTKGYEIKEIPIDVEYALDTFADFKNQIEAIYTSTNVTLFNEVANSIVELKKNDAFKLLFDNDKNINQHDVSKILDIILKGGEHINNIEEIFDKFLDNLINYKAFRSTINDGNTNTSYLDAITYKNLKAKLDGVKDEKVKRLFKFLMMVNAYASRESDNTIIKNLEINLLRLQQEVPDYNLEYKNFILFFNVMTSYSRNKFIIDKGIVSNKDVENTIEATRYLFEEFLASDNYVFRLNHNILAQLFDLHVNSVEGVDKLIKPIDVISGKQYTLRDGSNIYITRESLFGMYDAFNHEKGDNSTINSLYLLEKTLLDKVFTFNSEGYVIVGGKKRSLKDVYDEENREARKEVMVAISEALGDNETNKLVTKIFEKVKGIAKEYSGKTTDVSKEFKTISNKEDNVELAKYLLVDNRVYYVHLMELMRTTNDKQEKKDIKTLMVLSYLLGNLLYDKVKEKLSENNNLKDYKIFERVKKEERIYSVNFKKPSVKKINNSKEVLDNEYEKNILVDQIMSAYFTFPRVSKSGMIRLIKEVGSVISNYVDIFEGDVFVNQIVGDNSEQKYFFNWSYFKNLLETLLIHKVPIKDKKDSNDQTKNKETYIESLLNKVIESVNKLNNTEDILVYIDSGNELFNNITSPAQYTAIFGLSSAEFNDIKSPFYYVLSTFERAYLTNTFFDKTIKNQNDTELTTGNEKIGHIVNPKNVTRDDSPINNQVDKKQKATLKLHNALVGDDVTIENLPERVNEIINFSNNTNIINKANVSGLRTTSLDSIKRMLKSFYYDSIEHLYSLDYKTLSKFYDTIEGEADRLLNTFMRPYLGLQGNIKQDGDYKSISYDIITESKKVGKYISHIKNRGRMDLLNRDMVMKYSNLLYSAISSTLYGFDKVYSYRVNEEGAKTNLYLMFTLNNKELTEEVIVNYQKYSLIRNNKRNIIRSFDNLKWLDSDIELRKLLDYFFDYVVTTFDKDLNESELKEKGINEYVKGYVSQNLNLEVDDKITEFVEKVVDRIKDVFGTSFEEGHYEQIKALYFDAIKNNSAKFKNAIQSYLVNSVKEKEIKEIVKDKVINLLKDYGKSDVTFYITKGVKEKLIDILGKLNSINISSNPDENVYLGIADNDIDNFIQALLIYGRFWKHTLNDDLLNGALDLFIHDDTVKGSLRELIASRKFKEFKELLNEFYDTVVNSFGVIREDGSTNEYNYNKIKLDSVSNNNEVLLSLKWLSESLNIIVELLVFKNKKLNKENKKLDKVVDTTLYDVATLYSSVFAKHKRKFSDSYNLEEDIYARFLAPTIAYLFGSGNSTLETTTDENNYKAILDTAFSYDEFLLNDDTTKATKDSIKRLFYDLNKDNESKNKELKWFNDPETDNSYWQVLNKIADTIYNDTIVRPLKHSVNSFSNTLFLYDSLVSDKKLHLNLVDYSLSDSNPADKKIAFLMWTHLPLMLESPDQIDKNIVSPSRWVGKMLGSIANAGNENYVKAEQTVSIIPSLHGRKKTHKRFLFDVNKYIRLTGRSANRQVTYQLHQLSKQSSKMLPIMGISADIHDVKDMGDNKAVEGVTNNPSLVNNIHETLLMLQQHILLKNPTITKSVRVFLSAISFSAVLLLMYGLFSMIPSVLLILFISAVTLLLYKLFRGERFDTMREKAIYKAANVITYIFDIGLSVALQPIFYALSGFLTTERIFSSKRVSWFTNRIRKYMVGQALSYAESNNRMDFNNKDLLYSVISGLGNIANILGLRNSIDSSAQNAVAFDSFMEYGVGGYTISDIFELDSLSDKSKPSAYILNFKVKDKIKGEASLDELIKKLESKGKNRTDDENKVLTLFKEIKNHIDAGNKSISLSWIVDTYSKVVDNKFLSHIYDKVSNVVKYQMIKTPFKSVLMLGGVQFVFIDVIFSYAKDILKFSTDSLTRGKSLTVLLLSVLVFTLFISFFIRLLTGHPGSLQNLYYFIIQDPSFELNLRSYNGVVGYFKNILVYVKEMLFYNGFMLFMFYVSALYATSKLIGQKLYQKYNNYFMISLLTIIMFNTSQIQRKMSDVGTANPIEVQDTKNKQESKKSLIALDIFEGKHKDGNGIVNNKTAAEDVKKVYRFLDTILNRLPNKDYNTLLNFLNNAKELIDTNRTRYLNLMDGNYKTDDNASFIKESKSTPRDLITLSDFVKDQEKFATGVYNRVVDTIVIPTLKNDSLKDKIVKFVNAADTIKGKESSEIISKRLELLDTVLSKEVEKIEEIVEKEFENAGLGKYTPWGSYSFREKYLSVGKVIAFRAIYEVMINSEDAELHNVMGSTIPNLKSNFKGSIRINFSDIFVDNKPDPTKVIKDISKINDLSISDYLSANIDELNNLLKDVDKINESNWREYFVKLIEVSKGKFIPSLLGVPDLKSLFNEMSMIKDYDLTQPKGFLVTAYRAYDYNERGFNNIRLVDFINDSFQKTILSPNTNRENYQKLLDITNSLPYEYKLSWYLNKLEITNPLIMGTNMFVGKGSVSTEGKLPDYIRLFLNDKFGVGKPIQIPTDKMLKSRTQRPEIGQ